MDLPFPEWANLIPCFLSPTPIQTAWERGTMPISALCDTRNPRSVDRVDSSSPIRATQSRHQRKTRSSDWYRIDSESRTPFLLSKPSLGLRVRFGSSTNPMGHETEAFINSGRYVESRMTQPSQTAHLPSLILKRNTRLVISLSAFHC